MSGFVTRVALGALLLGLPALAQQRAQVSSLNGVMVIRAQSGDLYPKRARLEIPPQWKGDVTLALPGLEVASSVYGWTTPKGGSATVSMIFSQIPTRTGPTMIGLKGIYTTHGYSGVLYAPSAAAIKAKPDMRTLMKSLMGTGDLFEEHGNFYFTAGRLRSGGATRSEPLSREPNNPCPNGPGWTTAGVGRYAEYYPGGPIQNPGARSYAASFERGVPQAWTRQGQLQAQAVGVERYNAIQTHIDRYGAVRWGWGFFFPW